MSQATFAPIQAYLRKSASRDRITEYVSPFLATISSGTNNPYMNYAIPDDNAAPSAADVQALIAAFQSHQRKPRLEYIRELAPQVEPALIAHGFEVELTTPLMVYKAAARQAVPTPAGIEMIAPQTDQDILDNIAAANEAYAAPGTTPSVPSPDAVARWRRFLAAGGIMASARDIAMGKTAGSGTCDAPFDATCELNGVGVRTDYRRRGIAAAMTAWLVDQALASGTTHIFLMAAGEDEARIYGRAGFQQIGQVLHISLP